MVEHVLCGRGGYDSATSHGVKGVYCEYCLFPLFAVEALPRRVEWGGGVGVVWVGGPMRSGSRGLLTLFCWCFVMAEGVSANLWVLRAVLGGRAAGFRPGTAHFNSVCSFVGCASACLLGLPPPCMGGLLGVHNSSVLI
jgi:hypothetical protein